MTLKSEKGSHLMALSKNLNVDLQLNKQQTLRK